MEMKPASITRRAGCVGGDVGVAGEKTTLRVSSPVSRVLTSRRRRALGGCGAISERRPRSGAGAARRHHAALPRQTGQRAGRHPPPPPAHHAHPSLCTLSAALRSAPLRCLGSGLALRRDSDEVDCPRRWRRGARRRGPRRQPTQPSRSPTKANLRANLRTARSLGSPFLVCRGKSVRVWI